MSDRQAFFPEGCISHIYSVEREADVAPLSHSTHHTGGMMASVTCNSQGESI